jgi:hypothetical protein
MGVSHDLSLEMRLTSILSVALESRRAVEHKDVVRWLAPGEDVPLAIDFYQTELTAAYSSRQPGTCEWILHLEKYLSWTTASPHDQQSFLWITAIPGAGKTVLAAFVTFYHFAIGHKATFYFFFNSTDGYMTTPLGAGKCLLYQLYMYARETGETSHLDLQNAMGSSGGSKAKSFEAVWGIVLKYAGRLISPVFIIDALDEVTEPDLFLSALLELVQKTSARVLLTSRPSAVSPAVDSKFTVMEFSPQQRNDIEAYIESRTTQGLTSLPQIRSTIVKALVAKNDGMFLWVRLILEELESCYSIEEMELVLKALPTDLDGVYVKILKNLSKALKQSQKEFCHKILIWLFCTRRPLSMQELYAAMMSEYAGDGFLYTADTISQAIRAACGPLVVFRMDSIRLIHFSLKEFLTKSPEQWSSSQQELQDFHINISMGNLHILKICLANFESMASTESFIATDDGSSKIDFDFSLMKDRWPLAEYTSLNWMNHAWQSGPTQFETLQVLRAFVEGKASVVWIYASLSIDVGYMEQLRWNIRSILMLLGSHLTEGSPLSSRLDDIRTCCSWCNFVTKLISDYGNTLQENPAILFDLDLQALAQKTKFRPIWISQTTRTTCQRVAVEESFTFNPTAEVPVHRQLHMDVKETGNDNRIRRCDPAALGLFRLLKRYDAFIYASYCLSSKPQLLIQECSTGKRLAGITCDIEINIAKSDRQDEIVLLDSAISEDETRVAAVYCTTSTRNYWFFTCVWQFKKDFSFYSDPFEAQWAEVAFHATTFQPAFRYSASLVAFANNYLLWCPAGLVDTTTGLITPYSMKIPGVQSTKDEATPDPEDTFLPFNILTLYGRGDIFIFNTFAPSGFWASGPSTERLSITGEKLGDVSLPLDEEASEARRSGGTKYIAILGTDEGGRFIVWEVMCAKSKGVVLHDTKDGKHVTLRPCELEGMNGWNEIDLCLFVDDPKILIYATYNTNRLDLRLSTWDISLSNSGPKLVASREYRDNLCGMCASMDGGTLYLVTTNRTITRLMLPNLEEKDDYLGFQGQQRAIETFPAADATRMVSVQSDETRYVSRPRS